MFTDSWWPMIIALGCIAVSFGLSKLIPRELIYLTCRLAYRGTGVEAKFQEEIARWKKAKAEHSRLSEQLRALGDSIQDEFERRRLQGELNQRAWAVDRGFWSKIIERYSVLEKEALDKDWQDERNRKRVAEEDEKKAAFRKQQDFAKTIIQEGRLLFTTLRRNHFIPDNKNDNDIPAKSSERRFYEYDGQIYLMELRRFENVETAGVWEFTSFQELETLYSSWDIHGDILCEEDLVFVTNSKSQFGNDELKKLSQLITA